MIKILLGLVLFDICLNLLTFKQNKNTMATLAQVQESLASLQSSVDAKQQQIMDEIKALKDQIASGGTVTEADLDGLLATVEGIKTDIDTTDLG